jgi:hypothetical protein
MPKTEPLPKKKKKKVIKDKQPEFEEVEQIVPAKKQEVE